MCCGCRLIVRSRYRTTRVEAPSLGDPCETRRDLPYGDPGPWRRVLHRGGAAVAQSTCRYGCPSTSAAPPARVVSLAVA